MAEEYTGGSVSYYAVDINRPLDEKADPYKAECQDIIDALDMDFNEGCAFKAIWRRAAARNLGLRKKGYDDGLYDAQKVEFYGARMVAKSTPRGGPISSDATYRAGEGANGLVAVYAAAGQWTEHDGKGCPVAAGTRVEVRYRGPPSTDRNEVFETKAGALWSWPDARPNYDPDNDIVAYRLA